MKIKEKLKKFLNIVKTIFYKIKIVLNKIKNIYIRVCKFISDTIHGKADGSLVNWFAILFVIGASIILPVSMGMAYYSYIGLAIVAEIVYFISIILLFSSTVLFDRKRAIYWISDILLLIRYVTLIDIGSEWNRQFNIAYVGVLIIYFVSLLSLSSAKHINYKGGKVDTIILAIGLAWLLIGVITSQSESIYSKILILTGIIAIYLYAISRVLFWILFAKEKVKFNLLKTMGCIVLFVGLIIAVPFILGYAGVSSEVIKEIIVPIYAAVVGGVLTLGGVAWTIKNSESARFEDERKKYIPYLKVVTDNDSDTKNIKTISLLYEAIQKHLKLLEDEKNNHIICKIKDFNIKNISNGIIILKCIEIDGTIYKFNGDCIIEKDTTVTIETTGEKYFYTDKLIDKICILCSDISANCYRLKCKLKVEEFIELGETARKRKYTYNIDYILSPEYIEDKKDYII